MLEKKRLSVADLEAQAALELPDREMMALVNIIIVDTLSGNNVNVQVPIGVAACVASRPTAWRRTTSRSPSTALRRRPRIFP